MSDVLRWLAPRRASINLLGIRELRFLGAPSTALGIAVMNLLAALYLLSGGAYADFLVAYAASYMVTAIGYNLVLGYSGQMVFSQAGFMAIGAYAYSIATNHGWNMALGIALALVVCLVVSVVLMLAVSRLRELYLALVTVAFSQAILVVINLVPATGGFNGITVIAPGGPRAWWALPMASVAVYLLCRLVRSDVGRCMVMIRDDEIAAIGSGASLGVVRTIAFAGGAIFGGLGGVMTAMTLGFISPENFTLSLTVYLLTIVVVGGRGSIWGSVIGSAAFVWVDDKIGNLGSYRDFVYAGVLMLALIVLPDGIASLWRTVSERGKPTGTGRPLIPGQLAGPLRRRAVGAVTRSGAPQEAADGAGGPR